DRRDLAPLHRLEERRVVHGRAPIRECPGAPQNRSRARLTIRRAISVVAWAVAPVLSWLMVSVTLPHARKSDRSSIPSCFQIILLFLMSRNWMFIRTRSRYTSTLLPES